MPTPLLVLFYLWVAVSVVILGYRLVTRGRRSPGAKVVKAADLDPLPSPTEPPPMARPATAPPGPARGPSGFDRPPVASTPLTPPTPPIPATARRGPDDRPATSLTEVLAGISLPCDLLPLTTVEGRTLGPRDLLLVTSDHPAQEVGRALAAAVAELGFEITPLGSSQALASRGPDQITMTVHDRPDTMLAGKRPAFPTVRYGDVIVELRL